MFKYDFKLYQVSANVNIGLLQNLSPLMLPYKILKTKSKLPLRVKIQQELDLKKWKQNQMIR